MEALRKRTKKTQKEQYRLWWEFYHLLMDSEELCEDYGLGVQGKEEVRRFYRDKLKWGRFGKYKNFDSWWRQVGSLIQRSQVRDITSDIGDERKWSRFLKRDLSHTMVLEVPLDRSPSSLARSASFIIKKRWNQLQEKEAGQIPPRKTAGVKKSKAKRHLLGFTEGREIRVKLYRGTLLLYKQILRKDRTLKGEQLLNTCNDYQRHLLAQGRTKYLLDEDYLRLDNSKRKASVLRNLDRAGRRIDTAFRAIVNGHFPGKAE